MKYFLIIALFILTGCDQKVVKVYVDENGTEIKKDTVLPVMKMSYVCDERGYKYYRQYTYMHYIYLPLFENIGGSGEHGRQVRCTKDER